MLLSKALTTWCNQDEKNNRAGYKEVAVKISTVHMLIQEGVLQQCGAEEEGLFQKENQGHEGLGKSSMLARGHQTQKPGSRKCK